ncbi:PREDICTED: pollen-specific leucine-rich repeat extensin-like protein 1 [Fragaria vesca subsp. vesca]|uniref:pollen-specific leucine-rich repeat extensin-like protein 1 n=1 Tax=Fragaria vesca subsp. vesca TaxID=101020 RepID=UPI0002C3000F|nr:PREDICTED: pollen-specific leucine-rich repeat extensin-like protein 1 [Fragaria vesca subsp. vesca]
MPRHHRSSSSPLLSPPVLIILLPTVILLFLIYAIPPFLSLTSHILQPTVSVKKSWDSLNVFLVIFAILCGVFARKHDDAGEGLPDPDHHHVHIHNANSDPLLDRTTSSPQSESSVLHVPQQQWFGYSERTSRMYDTTPVKTPENVSGDGRLRRRSSYPDMRQVESLWETLDDTKSQFRFFDDFEISNYKTHRHYKETTSDDVKEIKVDTFVLQPSPTPPPPPPPPPPRREKQRTYETVGRRSKEKVEEVKFEEVRSTPPPPPPPPSTVAPPSPMRVRSDQKHGRLERRKSNVKKEIAMVWNSVLSNQRKRKRKQKATRNIYDTAATTEPPPEQSQPPPPPPPPPPSSVFHNLFKKGSKTKKVHSVPTAPPPPPPLPEVSVRTHQTRSRSTLPPPAPPTPPRPPPSAHSRRRPPLPTKPSTSYEVDNVNSGCQSPLIPIPPPPPPFKMPAMKFFVKGDFVKIRSAQSSRSASPEPEEVVADHALPAGKEESTTTSTVNVTDGGDGAGRASPSVFCPSPDVNTKADNFIARLRDEWRLEKINSLREKKMN